MAVLPRNRRVTGARGTDGNWRYTDIPARGSWHRTMLLFLSWQPWLQRPTAGPASAAWRHRNLCQLPQWVADAVK